MKSQSVNKYKNCQQREADTDTGTVAHSYPQSGFDNIDGAASLGCCLAEGRKSEAVSLSLRITGNCMNHATLISHWPYPTVELRIYSVDWKPGF